MKKALVAVLMLFVFASTICAGYVRGYYKKNGTYVNGYYRADRDTYKWNNYGSSSTDGLKYSPQLRDHDSDGVPNYLDIDDDNDGIFDDFEAQ